ncbi:hypothetical protein, partial [Streptomyces sp. NPDC097640]|uniref:hypothetical protein n=1 Tax=Streptomyces sp. NPDC097640 TaxID=3157229 RepID=UPI003320BE04
MEDSGMGPGEPRMAVEFGESDEQAGQHAGTLTALPREEKRNLARTGTGDGAGDGVSPRAAVGGWDTTALRDGPTCWAVTALR